MGREEEVEVDGSDAQKCRAGNRMTIGPFPVNDLESLRGVGGADQRNPPPYLPPPSLLGTRVAQRCWQRQRRRRRRHGDPKGPNRVLLSHR